MATIQNSKGKIQNDGSLENNFSSSYWYSVLVALRWMTRKPSWALQG